MKLLKVAAALLCVVSGTAFCQIVNPGGGGSGSTPTTPEAVGTLYAFGDSTFYGTAGTTSINVGAIGVLSDDFPGSVYNYAIGGTEMPNIVHQYLQLFPAGNTATTRIPTSLSNGGVNDANNRGLSGITNYSLALNAGIAWTLTPPSLKVMASTCTAGGTWIADTSLNVIHISTIGTARSSTTIASTLSCVVPSNNGRIGVTWGVPQAPSGGTFTVAIDGVAQTETCSGTTTFHGAGCTLALNSNTVNRQDFPVSAGSHTVLITVTSATSASNPVYIYDVDTNPSTTVGQPNFIMSGVLRQTGDAIGSVTLAYDNAVTSTVSDLASKNYNVIKADVRNGTPGVNTTTDMTNAVNAASPCQGGAASLHPNNCGYLNYALTIENAAKNAGFNIFYPGLGMSSSEFGNLRIQGQLTIYDGPLVTTHSAQQVLPPPTNFMQINAANTIENVAAIQANATQFAPGICFFQNCSANMTGVGLTWDTINSRFMTGFMSTFSMGFQHCNTNATNPGASCRTDLYTDPTVGFVVTPQGFNGRSKGVATLVGGTVTVATTTAATPSSTVTYQLTNCGVGGTVGILSVGTVTGGTSFVINSSSVADTSTVCWIIL